MNISSVPLGGDSFGELLERLRAQPQECEWLDALDAGVIAPHDPDAGRRHMQYVPFWAKRASSL